MEGNKLMNRREPFLPPTVFDKMILWQTLGKAKIIYGGNSQAK